MLAADGPGHFLDDVLVHHFAERIKRFAPSSSAKRVRSLRSLPGGAAAFMPRPLGFGAGSAL